ncbi:helix-turn-helix transcriptional regulator [Photobacterium leiognathi]|uniref:helix-turn-helix transcriptional regulator n=1 Tax=Photobacterium leiognathi TaxID=553611 RepID=UPI00298294F3|nr:helix-turn-helix transcriptional regulator [Photobacterium leiognathi]
MREERTRQGFTQVQMAEKLKIARQTYLDIESGKKSPKLSMITAIAEILDKEVHFFISERPRLKSYSTLELLAELEKRDLSKIPRSVNDLFN